MNTICCNKLTQIVKSVFIFPLFVYDMNEDRFGGGQLRVKQNPRKLLDYVFKSPCFALLFVQPWQRMEAKTPIYMGGFLQKKVLPYNTLISNDKHALLCQQLIK